MRRLIPTLLLCCCLSLLLNGQSAANLETKRKRLLADLERTNRELALTRAQRGAALSQAELLRVQVEQRRELIATLAEEVNRSEARIQRDSGVVAALTEDLADMKVEYGHSLRLANRLHRSQGWLVFLLSAEDFNGAFRRWQYLRQYRDYRLRQGTAIRETTNFLRQRLDRLAARKTEQDSLLVTALEQGNFLEAVLREQTEVVARLTASERQLLARVERQRRQSEALGEQIAAIIEKNIAEEAEEVAATLAGAGVVGIAARRGRLAWPARGDVVRRFGTQPHPEVPSVKIKNSGIDIAITDDTPVEAIFAGRVISVRNVPGFQRTLMIRHGRYYTVYSNLRRTSVERGDEVQAGDRLGFTAGNKQPLHFEIWRGREPLNPQKWLAR